MQIIPEDDLIAIALKNSRHKMDEQFLQLDIVFRTMVANCLLHGFFMGARWREKDLRRVLSNILFPSSIESESKRAAKFYLNESYRYATPEDQRIVLNTISISFQDGAKYVDTRTSKPTV